MTSLTNLDILFILIYVVTVLLLGYRSSRKESNEGFLLADRKLGAFENAATIIASKVSAGTLLTFVALIYLYGVSAMWFFIGAAFGYVIFMFFAVRLRKASSEEHYYTLSDYFFNRYGKNTGFVSAFVILTVISLSFIAQLIGGSKVLSDISGFSYLISLTLISSIILIYLVLGGFKAVVKTDIAQFIAIIIIFGLLGVLMISNKGISIENINPGTMPITSIIGFFIFGIIMPFASAELWQRIYAARDIKTVRKSMLFSVLFYIIIGLFISMVGLVIRSNIKNIDPDLSMVQGFSALLPSGLMGIGIVAILAAIMSSADTYLFTETSILLQDFYCKIKIISKEKLVRLFRCVLLLLMIIGFVIALAVKSLINTAFIFSGFAGVIGITGMVSWLIKRVRGNTLIFGMVFGYLGTLIYILIFSATETLVLKSIIFTILGFFVGGVFNKLKMSK